MTPNVVCFGELLLRLSAPGYERLLQSPHLQVFFGGAEANVAAGLCSFGNTAAMISAVPQNPLGAAAIGTLRSQGIESRHVTSLPGRMGLYFYVQGAMQRPSEVVYDRANSSFALAPSNTYDWEAILKGAKWFHVSGITAAVSDQCAKSALAALQTARKLGVKVSFDCNYRARVWGDRAAQAPKLLRELCAHANLLFADDRDLSLMLGDSATPSTAFKEFSQLKWIARTQRTVQSVERQLYAGELLTADKTVKSRTYDLSGIVERIGAGDAFAAGLLHKLLSSESDMQAAIDFATAAACYKHSMPGDACIAAVSEIEALLQEGGADIRR
jgi:2-dehydro-3-deoxygluconokinase